MKHLYLQNANYKPLPQYKSNIVMTAKNDIEKDWEQEVIKCKESPYYYATTYLQINGKAFTTILTESEFNTFFNKSINAVAQG